MALEPDMGITSEDIDKFTDQTIPETTTYLIDFHNGRLSGKISDIEAVQQYIYKTLKTECNKYLIYDLSVGTSIKAMIRNGRASRSYIEADIPRMVRKALTDKRILNVRDFKFEYPDDDRSAIRIQFVAETIYGRVSEEVVV